MRIGEVIPKLLDRLAKMTTTAVPAGSARRLRGH
jgi:hypothetical protein